MRSPELNGAPAIDLAARALLPSILPTQVSTGEEFASRLGELAALAAPAIAAEVHGPIDQFWRSSDWIARAQVAHIASPGVVTLQWELVQIQALRTELSQLAEVISESNDPQRLQATGDALAKLTPTILLPRSQVDMGAIASQCTAIAALVYGQYQDGENVMAEAALVEGWKRIGMSLPECRTIRDWLLDPITAAWAWKSPEHEQNRALCECITLDELLAARAESIDAAVDFLRESANWDRVEEFRESLFGLYDGPKTLVNMMTDSMKGAVVSQFRKHVITEESIAVLRERIVTAYAQCPEIVSRRIVVESTVPISADSLVRSSVSAPDLRLGVGAAQDGSSEDMAQAAADTVDALSIAADVAMIVAGILGAPASAGTSLLATAFGALSLCSQLVVGAISAEERHIATASITCKVHDELVRSLLGPDVSGYSIGGAIVDGARSTEPSLLQRVEDSLQADMRRMVESARTTKEGSQ